MILQTCSWGKVEKTPPKLSRKHWISSHVPWARALEVTETHVASACEVPVALVEWSAGIIRVSFARKVTCFSLTFSLCFSCCSWAPTRPRHRDVGCPKCREWERVWYSLQRWRRMLPLHPPQSCVVWGQSHMEKEGLVPSCDMVGKNRVASFNFKHLKLRWLHLSSSRWGPPITNSGAWVIPSKGSCSDWP